LRVAEILHRLATIPGAGHNFVACLAKGFGDIAWNFLFQAGKPGSPGIGKEQTR